MKIRVRIREITKKLARQAKMMEMLARICPVGLGSPSSMASLTAMMAGDMMLEVQTQTGSRSCQYNNYQIGGIGRKER